MLFALALITAQTQPAIVYDAKLGKPYLLGRAIFVYGTNERLYTGTQRLIALKSAETCLAFGAKEETLVAGTGKKLVVFHATIENPETEPISVNNSNCFGIRIYEAGLKPGDVKYLGSFTESLEPLRAKIETHKRIDTVSVYEFPESSPHLRIGIWFDVYDRKKAPKYDLTASLPPAKSVFAATSLVFRNVASARSGQWFDLDDLEYRVIECAPTSEGFQVRIEVRNPMRLAGRWGWQYGKASLEMSDGTSVPYYPDFFVEPAYENWGHELKAGSSVIGAYKFTVSAPSQPKSFSLTSVATGRRVSVQL